MHQITAKPFYMNGVKRIFGVVWVLLAPVALYFIVSSAMEAFNKANKGIVAATNEAARAAAEAAKTNAILQWGIITVIFLPIAAGLVIFGVYAIQGEYSKTAVQEI